jgi:hypothetical protein
LPVSDSVYERLSQRFNRILVHSDAIQPNHFHWMPGIAFNERNGTVDHWRHRAANVLVVAGIAVSLRSAIRVGQDTTLWKHRRRIPRQQNDAGGGGIVLASFRVMPHQPTK